MYVRMLTAWGQYYEHFFTYFQRNKKAFLMKTNFMVIFLKYIRSILSKLRQFFFFQYFGKIIFKYHGIGPW
jgi:hypothetical protein